MKYSQGLTLEIENILTILGMSANHFVSNTCDLKKPRLWSTLMPKLHIDSKYTHVANLQPFTKPHLPFKYSFARAEYSDWRAPQYRAPACHINQKSVYDLIFQTKKHRQHQFRKHVYKNWFSQNITFQRFSTIFDAHLAWNLLSNFMLTNQKRAFP